MPHKSLLLKFCTAGVLSLCIVGSTYGQTPDSPNPPVCDRTEQVRNSIVNATGVSDCANVTGAQLAAITFLGLADTDITELRSGDFAGLTNTVLTLIIANNQLQTLPADIFAGISPAALSMTGNPFGEGLPPALIADLKMTTLVASITLDLVFVEDTLPTAPLALTVGDTMEVDLEDAFFYAVGTHERNPADRYEITVAAASVATAAVNNHTLTISAASAGQTDIDIVGVQTSNGHKATQTLTVEVYPPPNPPVCDRTEQVRNSIVNAIAGVSDCANVTGAQLAAITFLSVADEGITALKSGDFAGLTNTVLTIIIANNQLQTLPADIFAGISPVVLSMTGNPFGEGLPPALIADLKTKLLDVTINLDLVFVEDTLPTAPLALTVGDTMEVDLEDAFFYAVGTGTRNPADRYEITVAAASVATAAVNNHTLTITAASAGQTDIDVVGVQTSNEHKATQTLTVEVPAESLKFRIKVFLEGAQ